MCSCKKYLDVMSIRWTDWKYNNISYCNVCKIYLQDDLKASNLVIARPICYNGHTHINKSKDIDYVLSKSGLQDGRLIVTKFSNDAIRKILKAIQ